MLDGRRRIIALYNDIVDEVGDNFLYFNDWLEKVNMPKVKKIGNKFMNFNSCVKELEFENAESIGSLFLPMITKKPFISLPKVKDEDKKSLFLTIAMSDALFALGEEGIQVDDDLFGIIRSSK